MRLAMILVAVPLAALVSCAGWEVRPESAVIMAPPDEVWNTAQELLRERDFKVSLQDSTKRELEATKDIVLRVITDKSTKGNVEKERHQIDLSVKARGEDTSLVEVTYRIEKLVVEDPAFRFIAALRDRVTIRSRGSESAPSRRR
jgi:hypothetical protein